jgi:predicted nucleic acid-binding protein
MQRIFVDTSAWVALANSADASHSAVRKVVEAWDGRLVTTNLVVAETVTVTLFRFGHAAAMTVGNELWGGTEADVVRVEALDERAAWTLFCERADKLYSFTDCASFIIMRRLGMTRAMAVDDDFAREGFEVVPPRTKRPR